MEGADRCTVPMAKPSTLGQIVTVTGGGWAPGEKVTLSFLESPLSDTNPNLTFELTAPYKTDATCSGEQV
jgi:hypothetical protein